MLYLAKFDLVTLIGCESNSMASVAKALRITRQSFHEKVTRIADTLKLDANREYKQRGCKRRAQVSISNVKRLVECQGNVTSGRDYPQEKSIASRI